jgi:hypothetical protein
VVYTVLRLPNTASNSTDPKQPIECATHGSGQMAYVCEHLAARVRRYPDARTVVRPLGSAVL